MKEREDHVVIIDKLTQQNDKCERMAGQLHDRIASHIFSKRKQWKGKKRFTCKRRPYQNYSGIDLGSAFQFAFLIRNIKYAASNFNICHSTFRRHFKTWTSLGRPFRYEIEEKRGRVPILDDHQCTKLYNLVSTLILGKAFVNDFIVRRLIYVNFKVNVSPSFLVRWKEKFRISSLMPSYSRVATFNPHSAWIERQFLRDVKVAFELYDRNNIINADETFCRTFPHSLSHVYGFTNNGREGRQVKINVDVKQGITCMTTVTASGQCLSPFFVKKGLTNRCIQEILDENILATHSENGWMNETVAIKWIDDVILPHLNKQPGCLIWDIFRAHLTDNVKDHLKSHNIKPIYVPASMTWKRQPLDTHIFAVLKKKYQAFYFEKVFVENEIIKQVDTVYAYNQLMTSINKQHIVRAFSESILMDAARVPPIENDPNPHLKDDMEVETDKLDQSDDTVDDMTVSQYEDEPLDESSADELPEEMPSMRRPRQAHNVAYDSRMAQIYQSTIIKS